MLTKLVVKVIVEKEWFAKKLKSLGLSKRRQLVNLKPSSSSLSANHQCQLLSINRSSLYYTPSLKVYQNRIKYHITKTFEQTPIYSPAKVHQ
jgi:putative transposase